MSISGFYVYTLQAHTCINTYTCTYTYVSVCMHVYMCVYICHVYMQGRI